MTLAFTIVCIQRRKQLKWANFIGDPWSHLFLSYSYIHLNTNYMIYLVFAIRCIWHHSMVTPNDLTQYYLEKNQQTCKFSPRSQRTWILLLMQHLKIWWSSSWQNVLLVRILIPKKSRTSCSQIRANNIVTLLLKFMISTQYLLSLLINRYHKCWKNQDWNWYQQKCEQ